MISTRGRSGSGGGKQSSRHACSSGVFGGGARGSQAEGERGVLCMCVVCEDGQAVRDARAVEACVREREGRQRGGRMPEPAGNRQGKGNAQDANHTHRHKAHTHRADMCVSLLRMPCIAALLCSPHKKCKQRVIGTLACCFPCSTGNKQASRAKVSLKEQHLACPKGGQTT